MIEIHVGGLLSSYIQGDAPEGVVAIQPYSFCDETNLSLITQEVHTGIGTIVVG